MNKIQIDEAKGWEVLDALTLINQADGDRDFLSGAECYAVDKAITVLREALAEQPAQPDAANRKLTQQLEQEWVELRKLREAEQPAQQEPSDLDVWKARALQAEAVVAKFMAPHPAQRKPLTDEEIKTSWPNTRFDFSEGVEDVLMFARAIEAAHGIKENT